MGQLQYGTPPITFDLDDATVAHLEAVTIAKLRRNEPFAVSVPDGGAGRRTAWINVSSDLVFVLDGPAPELDRARLDRLLDGANSNTGIRLPID